MLWDPLQCFELADRQRLWLDTISVGAWRSIRAAIYAFEAFERWAKPSGVRIYPVSSINTVIAYILWRDKGEKCPASLPDAIQSSIKTVYDRLKIGPKPDFEDKTYAAVVAKIRNRARPLKMKKENAIPPPIAFVTWLEQIVAHGKDLEAIFAGFFLFMIWTSLRFEDAVQTDPRDWVHEEATISGKARQKGGAFRDWILANYSLGDEAWVGRWNNLIELAPPAR